MHTETLRENEAKEKAHQMGKGYQDVEPLMQKKMSLMKANE